MKRMMVLAGLMMVVLSAQAEESPGCYAYGRSYAAGESDCDGRVCQQDGTWAGVVKSGLCDVTEGSDDGAGGGRNPASVSKKHKKPHAKLPLKKRRLRPAK